MNRPPNEEGRPAANGAAEDKRLGEAHSSKETIGASGRAPRRRIDYADAAKLAREVFARARRPECRLTAKEHATLEAVVSFTALYSKAEDAVTRDQIAEAARLHPKDAAKALRRLAALALIEYQPGRGRKRGSIAGEFQGIPSRVRLIGDDEAAGIEPEAEREPLRNRLDSLDKGGDAASLNEADKGGDPGRIREAIPAIKGRRRRLPTEKTPEETPKGSTKGDVEIESYASASDGAEGAAPAAVAWIVDGPFGDEVFGDQAEAETAAALQSLDPPRRVTGDEARARLREAA